MKLKAQIKDEMNRVQRGRNIYKSKEDKEHVAYLTGVLNALDWVQLSRDDRSTFVADEELKTEARN